MNQETIVLIISYIIGGFVFVGINAFVVGRYVSGLATKEELKEKVKERDAKLKEQGDWVNRDFVRKDICQQAHHFMDREAARKDEEGKAFRNEVKESFHQLQKQLEALFERLPKKE